MSAPMTVNAFLQQPIRRLSEHYEVYVVCNAESDDVLLVSILNYVTVLPVRLERKVSLWLDFKALILLFSLFRKYDFQSVHSVTPKAGLLAMLAAYFSAIPVRVHTFTGQVWVTRRGLKRRILKNMDRLIALLATDILVDSPSQQKFLLDEGVISTLKSSVLLDGSISGVDIDRFKPNNEVRNKVRKKLSIHDRAVVFLFIGRLSRDKGVLDLALAFADVSNPQAILLIVGPDEEGLRFEMENILSDRIGNVRFVGFCSNPENYMAAADVMCLPSYREGFGSVVIEAAAVGIPTIGTKIYGVEDAIDDTNTGLLFEAGNVEELKARIIKLLNDLPQRARLGQQARKRAITKFSSSRLAQAWLKYYQEKL